MNLNGVDLKGRGATQCSVKDQDGKVILLFNQSVQWASFDPQTAMSVAESMARAAYACRFGVTQTSGRAVISSEIRARLVTRATHVIRSLQEKEKLPAYIAAQVVDVILSEVG